MIGVAVIAAPRSTEARDAIRRFSPEAIGYSALLSSGRTV